MKSKNRPIRDIKDLVRLPKLGGLWIEFTGEDGKKKRGQINCVQVGRNCAAISVHFSERLLERSFTEGLPAWEKTLTFFDLTPGVSVLGTDSFRFHDVRREVLELDKWITIAPTLRAFDLLPEPPSVEQVMNSMENAILAS